MTTTNAFLALATSAIALSTLSSQAEDWPQFRGPGSQGLSACGELPVSWSDSENMVWKTALPGAGASSPIALGDRMFLTAYSGYGSWVENPGKLEDLMLHVLCVDANTGKITWDTRIKSAQPEAKSVRDHGYAAGTPATDGKHIYCYFGKTGVVKLDLDGKQIWQTSVGDKTHNWGCGTSPVLFENLVIVNASVESGDLVALDKDSGKEAWRCGGMAASWNTPHLVKTPDGGIELAVSVKGLVLGFDPATGKELWRCKGIPDYICPSIVSRDGILYALGGRSSMALAIRSGGRGDVTDSHLIWKVEVGANVSSPVIHGDHLYWVSDRNKTAYCLSLKDGTEAYSRDLGHQPYASTLIADGKQYVVTRTAGTLVLAAEPKFKQLGHVKPGDKSTFDASPMICNGRLILRSNRYLYCLGK